MDHGKGVDEVDVQEAEQKVLGRKVEIAGGADGGLGEWLALGGAVGDFVADDGAEVGVGVLIPIAVAAAVVEIRAGAEGARVLIGPADEAVVGGFRFH